MTPEQILIEMEKENTDIAIDFMNHYNHSDDERLIGIVEALDKKDKVILQQKLEAKAVGLELDRILENAENGLLRATDVNRIRHLRNELLGDSIEVAGFTVVKDESIPEGEAHAINGNQKVVVKNIDMAREAETRKHARASTDKNKALLELLGEAVDTMPEADELAKARKISQTAKDRVYGTSAKNAQAQDLLTTHPLAEALEVGVYGSGEAFNSVQEREYFVNKAQKALTQHEALIKQSEAVWAVVEAAVEWGKPNNGDYHLDRARCDVLKHNLKALPEEALEVMEVKKDA